MYMRYLHHKSILGLSVYLFCGLLHLLFVSFQSVHKWKSYVISAELQAKDSFKYNSSYKQRSQTQSGHWTNVIEWFKQIHSTSKEMTTHFIVNYIALDCTWTGTGNNSKAHGTSWSSKRHLPISSRSSRVHHTFTVIRGSTHKGMSS